jgi:hypothetical protein
LAPLTCNLVPFCLNAPQRIIIETIVSRIFLRLRHHQLGVKKGCNILCEVHQPPGELTVVLCGTRGDFLSASLGGCQSEQFRPPYMRLLI